MRRSSGDDPDEATLDEDADALAAALAEDRPPLAARRRILRQRSSATFTSPLSTGEHAALRSVGLAPVGTVTGLSVTGLSQLVPGRYASGEPSADVVAARQGRWRSRQAALERMRREAAALGADGVVGVRLRDEPFLAVGWVRLVSVVGTAIRADGGTRAPYPFLCALSGQDVARLLTAGWTPVGYAMGVAVRLGWIGGVQRVTAPQPLPWATRLLHEARRQAANLMAEDARRQGASHVVVGECWARLREASGGARATAVSAGTALARLASDAPAPPIGSVVRLEER